MAEAKMYQIGGLAFELSPNGSPFEGLLMVLPPEGRPFSSHVSLDKFGSRAAWAREAADLYGMDGVLLKRALNELCMLRTEEVAAATEEAETVEEGQAAPPISDTQIDELVGRPGVLKRYVEDAAEIHGVVGERAVLSLQTLVAFGAQLQPLPNGKPAGANLIITAEAGRGKNYICDAVATPQPEEFYLAFESASAKSLYYKAEQDPAILKHVWVYPNEAEATDQLVEMFRPLLSGGKASHLTVNKDGDGRNTAQEFNVEGPASITIPTVRNKLDAQLQTRMLVAELPDYEGRVAAHSRASSRLLLPDYAAKDYTPKIRTWQAALRGLTAIRRVVFPLDREEFCFDSDEVSHGARLWGNLLGLMLAHAWLEQRNREIMELPNGEHTVVATPEDYEAAYLIFKTTCERSILNLSDTHRKILDAVYELQTENVVSDGYSQRRIGEKAGLHHSTVGEHKTFLTKSAKLLRETENGGLTLVAEAKPDWWRKGDELLAGFPRPEEVRSWWGEEGGVSASESAHHARHPQVEDQEPLTYAQNAGGQSNRHPSNAARHPDSNEPSEGVAGAKTAVADGVPATENGLDKPKSESLEAVAGVAGTFGSNEHPLCIHDYPEGIGCYLCDPDHPYRLKEEQHD